MVCRRHRATFVQFAGKGFLAFIACLVLSACATKPLVPFSIDTPPLVLVPTGQAMIEDKRARFREIFCAVLEAHRNEIPDYQPCEEALTRLAGEAVGAGGEVVLGASSRRLIAAVVPGIGYECFEPWLAAPGAIAEHVRKFGYAQRMVHVDALSGTHRNARQIRDAIMEMRGEPGSPRLVLIGYSKGAPDILEAVVTHPEVRSHVAAVVSVAGAVGGSPLANDAEQYQADLVRHFPKANCEPGDGKGVESLRPATRKAWLAANPLPREIRYYSLVALPQPERISWILESSHDKLSRIDARNDSQVIFYDAVVPGSTLLGYLNADHWAVALPIARTHTAIGALFVTQNAYPREALLEAVLRFVEEDLKAHGQ